MLIHTDRRAIKVEIGIAKSSVERVYPLFSIVIA